MQKRKNYKSLNESEKEQVITLYDELKDNGSRQYSYKKLGEMFNVSIDTIRRTIKPKAYSYVRVDESKDRRFVSSIDKRKQVIELHFIEGKSRKEIAKLLDMSYPNVTRLIAKYKIDNGISNQIFPHDIMVEIRQKYDNGSTISELMKEYNCTRNRINYVCKIKQF